MVVVGRPNAVFRDAKLLHAHGGKFVKLISPAVREFAGVLCWIDGDVDAKGDADGLAAKEAFERIAHAADYFMWLFRYSGRLVLGGSP